MVEPSIGQVISFDFNIKRKVSTNKKAIHVNHIDDEVWKVIPNFCGRYSVSNISRIKNNETNQLIRQFVVGDYLKVTLSIFNKQKPYFVHKLVAELYCLNECNYTSVDHLDTDTFNNKPNNLKWGTIKDNNNNPLTVAKQVDRLRSYNIPRKIKVIGIDRSTKIKHYFNSVLDAANHVKTSSSNVSRVCKRNVNINKPISLLKNYIFAYE